MSEPFPNFGCKIVFDEPFGKSHCEVCGRQWKAMTPRGSENHCARELGSRVADLQARLKLAVEALHSASNEARSGYYDGPGLQRFTEIRGLAEEALAQIGPIPE